MSEPIPESIPTSQDPRSKRPTKKRALTPVSAQAAQVDALFAHPEKDIKIPAGPRTKTLAPPPEIVANVQGSSAGAGSGEFHVYKASRRREYERLRLMEEEVRKEERDKDFDEQREEMRRKDEEKTSKNRARREKQRQRKEKQKAAKTSAPDADGAVAAPQVGKKLGPNVTASKQVGINDGEDEIPVENADAVEAGGLVIHDDD
jgi:hypothetical protein